VVAAAVTADEPGSGRADEWGDDGGVEEDEDEDEEDINER
jgi:hypothetical protein